MAHDERDRRADGPTLLRAEIDPLRRRWGRTPTSVRVTSRRLWWGPAHDEASLAWTQVVSVDDGDGLLTVAYVDDAGRDQVMSVQLGDPVSYLVAEEVVRRSDAARRNAVAHVLTAAG